MGVDETDVTRRRRNAAIALAALGAPLAAASPAVADDAETHAAVCSGGGERWR